MDGRLFLVLVGVVGLVSRSLVLRDRRGSRAFNRALLSTLLAERERIRHPYLSRRTAAGVHEELRDYQLPLLLAAARTAAAREPLGRHDLGGGS